ncbi:hypothetical protein niasHT_029371 [Heterodera trifolii]|uniref:Lon proteolytic domain-containing protein n=1 Tax=Heterodera trifolii TaxID=157864 RepID=A0ABD2J9Z8_9BILA
MVGVSVGLSRTGTNGGIVFFEVVLADPFDTNSSKGTTFVTAGGSYLDIHATDSLKNAYGAAKVIMREQRNNYLEKAHLHLNVVAAAKGNNKSGPSGGLAGGIAYVSMAKGAKIRPRCVVTGHLTLHCGGSECTQRRKTSLAQGKNTYLDKARLHMNVVSTESANKSGPSGGLAGGMAFVSLARGAKIRPNCAITGQAALYGAIVKVSGIAKKTKAACDARIQLEPSRL